MVYLSCYYRINMEYTEENVRKVLQEIHDPEIPVSIVELGLIYEIAMKDAGVIDITMTLTSAGCPMIATLLDDIKDGVTAKVKDVSEVNVHITFDPPWNPNMINEEALFALGIQPRES